MSTALRKENWLSGFWIVCGLSICMGSYRLSLGSLNDPGPGMFPFIAGAVLCVLSMVEWWNTTRAYRRVAHTLAQTFAYISIYFRIYMYISIYFHICI